MKKGKTKKQVTEKEWPESVKIKLPIKEVFTLIGCIDDLAAKPAEDVRYLIRVLLRLENCMNPYAVHVAALEQLENLMDDGWEKEIEQERRKLNLKPAKNPRAATLL